MKYHFLLSAIILLLACKKEMAAPASITSTPAVADTASLFTKFTILKGFHYCDKTSIKPFEGKGINLNVKFDSSAIYSNTDAANQADINKLVGFTEGTDNHVNSARIGWGWSNEALRLYAYSYAGGVRSSKEISVVAIGEPISISVSIVPNEYVFKVNQQLVKLPRVANSTSTTGYWQYPYFGGDETAPHDIFIYIQYL